MESLDRYRFGPYEFDECQFALRQQGGGSIDLAHKPAEFLQLLLRNAPTVLTHEEIAQHLWPDEPHLLGPLNAPKQTGDKQTRAERLRNIVSKVRAALGDDEQSPTYVETVPKRGYRFIAGFGKEPCRAGDATSVGRDSENAELAELLVHALAHKASNTDWTLIRNAIRQDRIIVGADDGVTSDRPTFYVIRHEGRSRIHARVRPSALEQIRPLLFVRPPGLPPPLPSLPFVGRDDALHRVRQLTGVTDTGAPLGATVVVTGMGGIGKTSLIGNLAYDPDVRASFPNGVWWTAVGLNPSVRGLLTNLCCALSEKDLRGIVTLDELTRRLSEILEDKRALLILDDVYDAAHTAPFIQARGPMCSLVVTTRQLGVASLISPSGGLLYSLPSLHPNASFDLLAAFATSVVHAHPKECTRLLEALGHLPLAIQVAGRILREHEAWGLGVADLLKTVEEAPAGDVPDEWNAMLEEVMGGPAPIDLARDGQLMTVHALFKKSTDLLPEAVRQCFKVLGAHPPKPATFDLTILRVLWRVTDPQPILRTLLANGLIEPAGPGRFQIHAMMAAHARSLH